MESVSWLGETKKKNRQRDFYISKFSSTHYRKMELPSALVLGRGVLSSMHSKDITHKGRKMKMEVKKRERRGARLTTNTRGMQRMT